MERRVRNALCCIRGTVVGEKACLEADDGEANAILKTWGFALETIE